LAKTYGCKIAAQHLAKFNPSSMLSEPRILSHRLNIGQISYLFCDAAKFI